MIFSLFLSLCVVLLCVLDCSGDAWSLWYANIVWMNVYSLPQRNRVYLHPPPPR